MKPNATVLCVASLIASTACTTLGPMPATTGVSAVPMGRLGFEVQAAAIPSFDLSQSTQNKPAGDATRQISLTVEPGKLLGINGLIAGLRVWGQQGDEPAEPYVGIRSDVGNGISLAGIAYGTVASARDGNASYSATRFGGELAADAVVIAGAWLSLHANASASATAISAHGTYCADANGIGVDCSNDGTDSVIDGHMSGLYPAGTVGASLDLGHRKHGFFNAARLAFELAGGQMPLMQNGVETSRGYYTSGGLSLTLGFGAD
jgi:hypothetical protein